MRRVEIKNGGAAEKLEIYSRVKDNGQIKVIEWRSENWSVIGATVEQFPFFILEQRDAYNHRIGYYKVIMKAYANHLSDPGYGIQVSAKYSENDWVYYERK